MNESIQKRGLRLTSRRRLVLEILEASREHLSAEKVYERARLNDPRISLATVYRTLALFKLLGVVEEHQFGEGHGHFEPTQGEPHYHFTCVECRTVSEFSASEVGTLARRLCRNEGRRLEQVRLELSGVCSACLAKRKSKAEPRGTKPLSDIRTGGLGRIRRIEGGHDFAARVISMGLTPGTEVTVIQNDGRGPILVGVQGTRIALGRGESAKIQVAAP